VLKNIAWGDYLYHFTRGCPGPWPAQSYGEYLSAFLDGGPFCSHSSLDTLARILSEGILRASSGLVRGKEAVVSWTSRPPLELSSLRFWNPGLIRWTFEPYGVAVKRGILKACGIKPTIYAAGTAHERLKPADRFRFQKHAPPHCSWKHEREWRTKEDFRLNDLGYDDWFVFVPNRSDFEALRRRFGSIIRVGILDEFEGGR
jgi:hypothetical protein